jgi:hypothetical protein
MAEPVRDLNTVLAAPKDVFKQQFMSDQLTPKELYAKLITQKAAGRASWWRAFDVVLTFDDTVGHEVCKLQCCGCQASLSPSNPSQRAKDHLKACKFTGAAGTSCNMSAIASSQPVASNTAMFGKRDATAFVDTNNQRPTKTIVGFCASASQCQAALAELRKFIYSGNIPLMCVDNVHLKEAFKILGVKLPSRTFLSTTMLDQDYAQAKKECNEVLAAQPYVGIATDGWRSKYAAMGTPLVNVCALLPEKGALFLNVIDAKDEIKDSEWIFEQHCKIMEKIAPGDVRRISHVIMDNTASNRSAMQKLEEKHPHMIAFGCQAHGLALLIKDLGNDRKCKWISRTYDTARMISNAINDSNRIKSIVHEEQQRLYNKVCTLLCFVN